MFDKWEVCSTSQVCYTFKLVVWFAHEPKARVQSQLGTVQKLCNALFSHFRQGRPLIQVLVWMQCEPRRVLQTSHEAMFFTVNRAGNFDLKSRRIISESWVNGWLANFKSCNNFASSLAPDDVTERISDFALCMRKGKPSVKSKAFTICACAEHVVSLFWEGVLYTCYTEKNISMYYQSKSAEFDGIHFRHYY